MPSSENARAYGFGARAVPPVKSVQEVRASLLRSFSVSPALVAQFRSLVARLRARGLRVLVVAMPVSPEFVEATPGGMATFGPAVSRLLEAGRQGGADTRDGGIWPQGYFVDAAHLNAAGTSRFSAQLGEWTRAQ